MLERERQSLILKLVNERSIVSVIDLVALLGASEATIRRDVNALAERGELRRIRGGAEAIRPRLEAHLVGMPFSLSRDVHASEKRAIARAAAALIEAGESIIISGGTTTFALAEFLVDQELDILTSSFPLAESLLATSRNRITLPGGQIFREQNIVLSPFPNDGISHFWGRKMFTGCFGINPFGLMEADPLIVMSQARLLERAEQVVVLADGSKLGQRSAMVVAGIERVSVVVTDESAARADIDALEARGVKVIVAQVPSEAGLENVGT